MPRVVPVERDAPAGRAVTEAAEALRAGRLVALPTETVYGLGARAFDERAIALVFAAKGRPTHHPLILHVLDERQARELAARWPDAASRLAGAFWPGPLTLVVDRAAHVPASVAGGGASIAVRAPAHPVARALIAALGEPIAAPSANRYQGLSPTAASHVVRQLGDAVDLVLDGGPCSAGIESTVVDVRGPTARVLRPGAVGLDALRRVLGAVEARIERAGAEEPRAAPGMDARHYAPRAPLHLVAGGPELASRAARSLASGDRRVGVVLCGASAAPEPRLLLRVLPAEPAPYARLLYGTLHDLDESGVDAIVVQAVPGGDAWWAVADRLRRAAAAP
ncbi:MAG TPA: L-threonylcarbamoyladenylate synthase [Polyangiaceae bacterium]|nr:L-threonylcarbamoyladenylate synthase [Polyangiaceae bacterium]